MATITQVLNAQNFGDHAIVEVELDNGEIGEVYIGGSVEWWYDEKYGKVKVFIKKNAPKQVDQ